MTGSEGVAMARYEFKLVVTDVELSEEQRASVDRAVVLGGVAALGGALPPEAVTAPFVTDDFLRIHWCGLPPAIEFPPDVVEPSR
jgi:hypothetical protein